MPQLSVHLVNFAPAPTDWSVLLDRARVAEEAGIDRVVVSDHVAFGERLEAYGDPALGGTAGGQQPTGPDGEWLDPLVVLSLVAGHTRRVRLGTSILLAALRTPAALAKQVATLDVLSGGRVDLGVGVGWQREEYEACGLDFEQRGRLLDRCLQVCRRLWTQPVAGFDDGELRFAHVHAEPKPVQPGGVPIWVSGRLHRRTLDRIVRFGSGWIPWGEHVDDPRPGVVVVRRALEDAGRDPSGFAVQGTLPRDLAVVPALVDAGITDFRVYHRWRDDPGQDHVTLAEAVRRFRSVVGEGGS